MKEFYMLSEVADILSVSKETLRRWDKNKKLKAIRHPINNYRVYHISELKKFEKIGFLFSEIENNFVKPEQDYQVVELFAGAGGLGLGLEKAGLKCKLLVELDRWACETLRLNRPNWNVVEDDVSKINFKPFRDKIDVVTGGFPCQAFSYAGKKLGFDDARGTLFFEFARAVKEINPPICLGENVRGLIAHDQGRTLEGMKSVLEDIGYRVVDPRILKAIFYKVPQKRERLVLVGIRKDIEIDYNYPNPSNKIYNLRDVLKKGILYDTDVPESAGAQYPKRKKEIMSNIPPGGYWKDLPIKLQKEYMQKSFYLGGGKTGIARRISWVEPCLTLTCNPAQKQTERCHPEETRPFTVREYARIQTFPDDWNFSGSTSEQYRQIGNAVPVNLAKEVGYSLIRFLNKLYKQI